MAADHVVGENLKLGLGIEFGRLRQEQRPRHLLAVGLLRARRDDDLALEYPARIAVEHTLEELAAHAMRHAVLDQERGVAMLPVAQEKGAGNISRHPLARKAQIDLIARERGAGRELEGLIAGVSPKLDEPSGKVKCVAAFPLHLDVLDRGLGANPELGYGIALQAPAAREALDQR